MFDEETLEMTTFSIKKIVGKDALKKRQRHNLNADNSRCYRDSLFPCV
jgi:hypothetical protein